MKTIRDGRLVDRYEGRNPSFRRKAEAIDKPRNGQVSGTLESEAVQSQAEEIESHFQGFNIQLALNIHETTGSPIVRVLNRDTGKLIRQIPSEHLLNIREKLAELRGLFCDEQV